MRSFMAIAVAVLLSVPCVGTNASAQMTVMPQGTWQSSCRNVFVKQSSLSADCRSRTGVWGRSTIDVNQCPSLLIANRNGVLTCEVSGGGGGGNTPTYYPMGSWRGTCKNFTMRGAVLTATCMENSGGFRTTSVNVDHCSNRLVANINGMLLCQPQ
jgi:hypothetical protein